MSTVCPASALWRGSEATLAPVLLSPAHEVVGLAVYQRAGDKPITMAMVHDVMTLLAAHPAVCSCGSCLWVGKADPVKDLARRRVLGRLWEIIS